MFILLKVRIRGILYITIRTKRARYSSLISLSSWTNIETCLLDAVESFLHCTCFLPTKENLTHLYNYVVNSRFARQLQLHVNEKTKKQVEGKLNFEKNKCMAARNLAYGVDAINRM